MKLFLDSAKIDEIEYALDTFDIDGVTTNPRHVQVSGQVFLRGRSRDPGVDGRNRQNRLSGSKSAPHGHRRHGSRSRKAGSAVPQLCDQAAMCGAGLQGCTPAGGARNTHQRDADLLGGPGAAGNALRRLLCLAFYRLEGVERERKQAASFRILWTSATILALGQGCW